MRSSGAFRRFHRTARYLTITTARQQQAARYNQATRRVLLLSFQSFDDDFTPKCLRNRPRRRRLKASRCALYRSGRVGDWLKTQCTKRQEVVIGGWRLSTASPGEIGSLLVGYYDRGKLQ